MNIAIVDKADSYKIVRTYVADAITNENTKDVGNFIYVNGFNNGNIEHVDMGAVPEHEAKAQDNAGTLEVVSDSDLIAANLTASRDDKINTLRSLREAKFKDSDIMHMDLTNGLRVDTTAVKDYVVALRGVTDDYVNHATDGQHATDVDAMTPSSFTWPTAP